MLVWLVGGGDRPAEAGELARDGHGDHGAALAAFGVESAPRVVQALLGLPGERDDVGVLAGLAALERVAFGGRSAVMLTGTPLP